MKEEWTEDEIETILYGILLLIGVGIVSILSFTALSRSHHSNSRLDQRNDQVHDLNLARQRRDEEEESLRNTGGKKLVDGILPFQEGNSTEWNRGGTPTYEWKLRQSRALEIVFQVKGASLLPIRGSNIVITLREDECDHIDTSCVLTFIGASYNVFVMLEIPFGGLLKPDERVKWAKNRLRKSGLSEQIIPNHRIIASQTIAGRVAFVRQLRPEVVIDFDEEVRKQLIRFGFRVLLHKGILRSLLDEKDLRVNQDIQVGVEDAKAKA